MNSKLFIKNINELKNSELYDKYYSLVKIERRKKIDSYKFLDDKCRSLAVEMLLMEALNENGIDYADVNIKNNENGKPYIVDSVRLYYNMSHSGEYAICVISDKEVGCDIEEVKKIDLQIAKRFFHKSEYEHIFSKYNEEEQINLFYRYWVLKESFVKNVGIGIGLEFDKFEIFIDDEKNNILINQNVSDKKFVFTEYKNVKGYKCAICNVI